MTVIFRRFWLWFLLAAAAAGPLPSQVYVWQRAWTPPVQAAVAEHASHFTEIAVLAAEVTWKNPVPQVTRVAVNYPALVAAAGRVGLALRVGPFNGELSQEPALVHFLAGLAGSLVAEARTNHLEPVELQIDFDCPTSKLADYRRWLAVVQRQVAPLPVTITALPSWLSSPAFPPLAATAPNYVLQVHSLAIPASLTAPFTLCDPAAARRAVTRAGEIGVPFRVALPTYGYRMKFNAAGDFIGLAAEATSVGGPGREVRADPLVLAALVQGWNTNRPASLGGVIWYRLPVAVDNLNWRWPTLASIMAGRVPELKFHAGARQTEAGLVEISLVNDGELDLAAPLAVTVHWPAGRLVAGDALGGFELTEPEGSSARFKNLQTAFRLPAGEKCPVGWLRFEQEMEVQLEVKTF